MRQIYIVDGSNGRVLVAATNSRDALVVYNAAFSLAPTSGGVVESLFGASRGPFVIPSPWSDASVVQTSGGTRRLGDIVNMMNQGVTHNKGLA